MQLDAHFLFSNNPQPAQYHRNPSVGKTGACGGPELAVESTVLLIEVYRRTITAVRGAERGTQGRSTRLETADPFI